MDEGGYCCSVGPLQLLSNLSYIECCSCDPNDKSYHIFVTWTCFTFQVVEAKMGAGHQVAQQAVLEYGTRGVVRILTILCDESNEKCRKFFGFRTYNPKSPIGRMFYLF